MAASLNKVILIGRVGQDPKVSMLPSGSQVAELSIATDESFKDRDGNKQERVEMNTEEMTRLYLDERLCLREIAEKSGLHISSVRKRLVKAGVKLRSVKESVTMAKGKKTDEVLFSKLYKAGKTYREISKLMDIPEIRVSRVARSLGLRRTEFHGFLSGGKRGRLYTTYYNMLKRCYKEKSKDYPRYGGRGIFVCEEWRNSFSMFAKWAMANGYQEDLVIDRKNSSMSYSPKNCRFVTKVVNARENRRGVYMTKELANKIRDERKRGVMPKEISKSYNVPVRAVYSIVCNQRWV